METYLDNQLYKVKIMTTIRCHKVHLDSMRQTNASDSAFIDGHNRKATAKNMRRMLAVVRKAHVGRMDTEELKYVNAEAEQEKMPSRRASTWDFQMHQAGGSKIPGLLATSALGIPECAGCWLTRCTWDS